MYVNSDNENVSYIRRVENVDHVLLIYTMIYDIIMCCHDGVYVITEIDILTVRLI